MFRLWGCPGRVRQSDVSLPMGHRHPGFEPGISGNLPLDSDFKADLIDVSIQISIDDTAQHIQLVLNLGISENMSTVNKSSKLGIM